MLAADGNPLPINSRARPGAGQHQRAHHPRVPDGRARRKIETFIELYNITNRANFGNIYGENQYAPATFNQPIGYLGGAGAVSTLPNSFQVQVGARISF